MDRRLRLAVLVSLALLTAGCTQAIPGRNGGGSNPNAWALEMTQADTLQERGLTGDGIKIAVVDTGVDASHEEFEGVEVTWRDFVNGRPEPYDDHGHGTHVSGLALGQGAGGISNPKVQGVAPGAELIAAKAIKGNGEGGSASDVADAIDWSVRQGADVLVLSLGQRPGLLNIGNQVENAARNAVDKGVVVVAAAGNAGEGQSGKDCDVSSPATVKGVIAVGAVGEDGKIARFSCGQEGGGGTLGLSENDDPHKKPELTAPGVGLVGPWPDRACAGKQQAKYCVLSGTSQATPIVGGIVALMLEENPKLERQDRQTVYHVKEGFQETARKVGFSGHHPRYGYGIVQAKDALRWVENNEVQRNDGGLPPIPQR